MVKYELPSGVAAVESSLGILAEREFRYPVSKKKIEAALQESLYVNLEQQEEIAELKQQLILIKEGL